MADIARIGFSADTKDLKGAKASLEQLVPAATRASQAADKFNSAAAGITANTKGASAGIKSFQSAAMGAAGGTDRLGKSALAAGTGMATVQRAAVGAAAPLNNLVATVARVGNNFAQADAHVEAYKRSLAGVAPAANGAASSLNRLGAAANDNINRLQSTPGNIAAQFQDIGVTAAGGMSPMLIALQQGTQLSAAMAGGLGNLARGLAQVFSPMTLLTIALVGLVAAGLQMVDWTELARWGLNALATALEQGAVYAAAFGAVMLVAFAPQIIGWITATAVSIGVALVNAIRSATTAMIAFSIANPWTAFVLLIGVALAAAYVFRDELTKILGVDIIQAARDGLNYIINGFIGTYKGIKAAWGQLPAALGDIAIRTANAVINGIRQMVTQGIAAMNPLLGLAAKFGFDAVMGPVGGDMIANPYAGAADGVNDLVNGAIAAEQGIDRVGMAIKGLQNLATGASDWLRGLASGLGAVDPEKGKDKSAGASEAAKAIDRYNDLIAATMERVKAIQVETTALGMSEHAGRLYRHEQELLAQALKTGIPITAEVTNQLNTLARALTSAEIDQEVAKATRAFEDQKRVLADQADLIGLTGLELEYTAIRQGLVNEAVKAGIVDLANMNEEMHRYLGLLSERAMILARGEQANKSATFMSDMTTDHSETMRAMKQQRAEMDLSGAALETYRYEMEMLASAREKNIELAPEELAQIKRQAEEYGVLTHAIEQYRERLEFTRTTMKGFFTDWFTNIRQGQSLFESFGNSVLNVLNRIFDRLAGNLIDKFITNLIGGLGGGGGGLGGFDPGNVNITQGSLYPTANALGGVYGAQQFGKGAGFSNSIVNKPTLFQFANGTALGEMGEAGPEAIMPLKRGSDGSLGVEMHGGAPKRGDTHVNLEVNSTYQIEGAINADSIVSAIRAAGEENEQKIKRQLNEWLRAYQEDGAVA